MVAAGAGAAAAPRYNPPPHRRRSTSALSPSKSTNSNANADSDALPAPKPKPKAKPVSSRYLLTPSSKSTSTSTSSTCSTSTSTSTSSCSSSTSASSRRFASPLPRRSASADRPRPASNAVAVAANVTATSTRSLSGGFRGPSNALETSKTKRTSPSPVRRPPPPAAAATTPERRRPSVGTLRGKGFEGGQNHQRWPTSARPARELEGSALTKSLDCSFNKKEAAVLAAVRSLRQSMVFDEGVRRAPVDGADYLTLSSDTESTSSGSHDTGIGTDIASRARSSPKSIITVPGRFLRDTVGSRSDRFTDPVTPFLTRSCGPASSSLRTAPVKKSLLNGLLSSQLNRSVRQPSPSKPVTSSLRRMAIPSGVRGSVGVSALAGDPQGKGSSGCNLDGDMRRRGWGIKVEEEHLLRILYNRHLQWQCANAQADAALATQTLTAEKYLCGAWIATLGMRKSVALKRFQLQLFQNNWKLMTVLREQMSYLEEWSLLEGDYGNSLSGTVEVLTATILCLPVTDSAMADIQVVKNAVSSAVDIMQTIGSSISTLLSKLAQTSILVSQLAQIAHQERVLMEQSRELVSTLASMHVKYCSLQGQKVQLTQRRLRCS